MPSSTPVVSVVIPTYNRAHCLPRAIESVLSQSYDRIEIIVVNDGSTDDTQSVLAEYGNRLHVISQPNAGPSAARNAGALASCGEIVTFLDSDDEWMSTKVERQVLLLESAGPSTPCCFCNMALNYADGRRSSSFGLSLLQPAEKEGIWVNPLQVLLTRFVLFNQAIAIRRDALRKLGGFNQEYKYMEDYDLSLRLALLGPWVYTSDTLAVWNEGSALSLTGQAASDHLAVQSIVWTIHQQMSKTALLTHPPVSVRAQLALELARRDAKLRAARLMCSQSAPSRWAGALIWRAEKLFDLCYTHSPFYPTMKVETLPRKRSDPLMAAQSSAANR